MRDRGRTGARSSGAGSEALPYSVNPPCGVRVALEV